MWIIDKKCKVKVELQVADPVFQKRGSPLFFNTRGGGGGWC